MSVLEILARAPVGLRGVPPIRDRFFARLDGLVGLTARGLLVPRGPGLPH